MSQIDALLIIYETIKIRVELYVLLDAGAANFFVHCGRDVLVSTSLGMEIHRNIRKNKGLMKRIIVVILLITSLLYSQATEVSVKYSNNNIEWLTLPPLDLDKAVVNPRTGKRELWVTIELPEEMSVDQLYLTANEDIKLISYSHIVPIAGVVKPPEGCVGIIFGIMVLVIAGVIVYYLLKQCKRISK